MLYAAYPEEFAQIKQFLPEVAPEVRVKIDEIVDINLDWQKEAEEKYPNLRAKGRPLTSKEDSVYQTSFETYLRGELMTYSAETVFKLHDYTLACLEKHYNMAIANLLLFYNWGLESNLKNISFIDFYYSPFPRSV